MVVAGVVVGVGVEIEATAAEIGARVNSRSPQPQRQTPLTTFRRSPRLQAVRLKLHRPAGATGQAQTLCLCTWRLRRTTLICTRLNRKVGKA